MQTTAMLVDDLVFWKVEESGVAKVERMVALSAVERVGLTE